MNTRALFLTVVVMFSLGCTSSNYSTNAGAQINALSFDNIQIAGGESAELLLIIENVGVKTMNGDSKVWIYNVPFSDNAWSLSYINGDTENKDIIADGETIATETFYPYDIQTGTSGAQISKVMLFDAPAIPSGMKETYDFTARMCYPYRTTSTSIITSVTPHEFKAIDGIEGDAGTINSAGPIQIALKGDNQIRYATRIPLPFIISDVGGGYPTTRDSGTDCTGEVADTPSYQRNRVQLTISVDGDGTDCTDKEISLDDNGQAVVWCNYEFSGTNPKNEYHITATILYNYFITRSAQIHVEGVLGAEDSFPTGGGGGPLVTSALLKSICKQSGQTLPGEGYDDLVIPICADESAEDTIFTYPGTDIEVRAQPLALNKDNRIGFLKNFLGSKYDIATIKTLNTHDLTANDLNMGELSLADLDSWYISSQYRKATMIDKVYVWCVDDKCTETDDYKPMYEPYVKPLGLLDALCKGCEKTTLHLVEKADILKETVTFAKHKYHTNSDEGVLLKDMESINGMKPQDFLNQPIYSLKITSIDGETVSEMTENSAKISAINMEDFYLKYLIGGDDIDYEYQYEYPMHGLDFEIEGTPLDAIISGDLNSGFVHSVDPKHSHNSLLDHISCGSSITHSPTTHSFCIVEASLYNGKKPPFDAFSASTTAECTAKCKIADSPGGCTSAPVGTFECKGNSIIQYNFETGTKKYGCSSSTDCLCYKIVETSLSSAEKLLLCGVWSVMPVGTGGDDEPEPDEPDEPEDPPEDELVVPVPADDGAMVIIAPGEGVGTCSIGTCITVRVTSVDGDITEYTFDALLSRDDITLRCTSAPCAGEITTEPLGTISLVNNDEREARISFTYDSDADECTFSSSIYAYEFKSLYNELSSQMTKFDNSLPAATNKNHDPIFAAELLTANANRGKDLLAPSGIIGVNYELDRLEELGVEGVVVAVNFPLFYPPFHEDPSEQSAYLDFYKLVAENVDSRGMKLIIENNFIFTQEGISTIDIEEFYNNLSTEEYIAGRLQTVFTIANELRPDYLTVVIEPDTEALQTGKPVDNVVTQTGYVEYVLYILKENDITDVKIGAGVGTWHPQYKEFITSFANTDVDYIDTHIYPINKDFFERVLTIADIAQSNGKPITMSETWLFKTAETELGSITETSVFARDVFSFWEPLDQKFLEIIVKLAYVKEFEFVSPFWTKYFFAYLDYNEFNGRSSEELIAISSVEAGKNIVDGKFTSTGLKYKELIK